ncbi:hypothetical protein V7T00_03720 [Segatella copri]|mgnify:CR=1 FL=1|jgi:hypothetical protein|uniref:hypothetical protein n=1 Tax=Segatella copri TaxID=165179 RepID=UPI00258EE510
MSNYTVEVNLSELYNKMLIHERKSFLVDKFCSLPIDEMVETVSELMEILNGQQVVKVIEDAFDNLNMYDQEQVINHVNE